MKELHTQIKKNESELSKLRSELDNKRIALDTMNEKVMNKIESELFQANRVYYLLNRNNQRLLRATSWYELFAPLSNLRSGVFCNFIPLVVGNMCRHNCYSMFVRRD